MKQRKLYVFIGIYEGFPEVVMLFRSKREAKKKFRNYTLFDYQQVPNILKKSVFGEYSWIGSDIFEVELRNDL